MIIFFNYSIIFFLKSNILKNGNKFIVPFTKIKQNIISSDCNLVRVNLIKFNESLLDEHKRDHMAFIYAQKVSNDNKAIKMLEKILLFTKKNAFHSLIILIKYKDELRENVIIDSISLTSTIVKSGKKLRIDENNVVDIIDYINEKGDSIFLEKFKNLKSMADINMVEN